MKKKIFFLFLFIFCLSVTSVSILNTKEGEYNSTYFIIKVHVYDKDGYPTNGSLVRCQGVNYLQCCYTVNGVCGFTVYNTGYYTICSSQNGYGDNGSVNVESGTFIYDVTLRLTNQGEECETCPPDK